MQLLSRSSVLHTGRTEADAHHPATAGSVLEDPSPALAAKSGAGAQSPYLSATAGLHMLDKGVAFLHDGKVHDLPAKKLYDTGSE
eukprot:scaffold221719_cov21-Tisochrysis_lutea.AAC.1